MDFTRLLAWGAKFYFWILVVAVIAVVAWAADRYVISEAGGSVWLGVAAGAGVFVVFLMVFRRVAR